MKWIVGAACVLVVLAIGLLSTRNTPRSHDDGWCMDLTGAGLPVNADGAVEVVGVVCVPAWGAGPLGYWMTARETCRRRGVDLLAKQFRTKPSPEAVALAYSRWMRKGGWVDTSTTELRAVYAGCLKGFGEA